MATDMVDGGGVTGAACVMVVWTIGAMPALRSSVGAWVLVEPAALL